MTDLTNPSSIALLGMGAIGTLLAFHWRHYQPLCIMRDGGHCQRELIDLQQQTHPLRLSSWQRQPLEWLIVTTKASDTLAALTPLRPKLHLIKRILLLQNGMGQQQQVSDWLQQFKQTPELWAGISTEGAYRHNTHQVIYAGTGETFIGRWGTPGQTNNVALPQITVVADIRQRIQAKLAINAVINPLTALYRCRNGELVNNPQYRVELEKLADETQTVFAKLDWQLPFDLRQRAAEVARATSNNQSSTLQDILNQRPTELAYISGFLWQQARQKQLELPITEQLLKQLKEI